MKTREDVNAWNARVVELCRLRQQTVRMRYEAHLRQVAALCSRAAKERADHEAELIRVRDEAAQREQARQDKLDAIEAKRLARLGMT